MKKYIKPATVLVNVKNEALLAGSFGNANDAQGYGMQGGFAKENGDDDWD